MPLVEIKLIEGVISDEKKSEMISKVTEAMVSVEGEGLRPYTVVLIEEIKSKAWAVGGKQLATEEVKQIASGNKKKESAA